MGSDELWPGGIWQSQSPLTKPKSQQLQASSPGIWPGLFELNTPQSIGKEQRESSDDY